MKEDRYVEFDWSHESTVVKIASDLQRNEMKADSTDKAEFFI